MPTRHSPQVELTPVYLPPGEQRGGDPLTERQRDLLRMADAVAVTVGEEDSPIGEFLVG
jgi:hypothetical protein